MARPCEQGAEKTQEADAAVASQVLGGTPSQMAAKSQAGSQPAKATTTKPPLERMTSSTSQSKVMHRSRLKTTQNFNLHSAFYVVDLVQHCDESPLQNCEWFKFVLFCVKSSFWSSIFAVR